MAGQAEAVLYSEGEYSEYVAAVLYTGLLSIQRIL